MRQREVLELIARGLDNAQIAARLEISEKTVRNNITHIFDKISVENRSQAIVLARESGLGKIPRCIEASKRIRWDIDRDVLRGRGFYFAKKSLPDRLSKTAELDFRAADEKRLLSQIQGRTYANMFGSATIAGARPFPRPLSRLVQNAGHGPTPALGPFTGRSHF